MAKRPNNPKPPGGKKQKINPATIKRDLKAAITAEMENIRRQKGLDILYLNKALGTGDMKTFEKEWEKHYENSAPLRKISKETKKEEELIKPRLTKVSIEYKPTTRKKK